MTRGRIARYICRPFYGSVLALFLGTDIACLAQSTSDAAQSLQHDHVFSYLLMDGSCLFGELEKADASRLTIRQYNKPALVILRSDLRQMGQGDELFYSARSSWSDVENAKIYAREALVLKLNDGKLLKGKPKSVTSDTVVLQQGLFMRTFKKNQIHAVLSLKLKPPTASFEFLLEEAAFFSIFTPEFYQRAFGLEGHVPVQLYDSSLPEDDASGIARCFPARSAAASTSSSLEKH